MAAESPGEMMDQPWRLSCVGFTLFPMINWQLVRVSCLAQQPGLVCSSCLRSASLGQCFKMTVFFHRLSMKTFVCYLDLELKAGPCTFIPGAASSLHTSGMP